MLIQEAKWLSVMIKSLSIDQLSPMLNIGCQLESYGKRQPYIEQLIYKPIRERGGRVVNTDLQSGPGVDIVGDITKEEFVCDLAAIKFSSVLCCNLLEHVLDPWKVCDALCRLVKPGGFLIITVPYKHHIHGDPIDTGFRPNETELCAMFPGAEVIKSDIIAGNIFMVDLMRKPTEIARLLVKSLLPFYDAKHWRASIEKLLWLPRRRKATCVVLRRNIAPDVCPYPESDVHTQVKR